MTPTAPGEWSVSASFEGGGTISYKYTRGSWTSVEKGAQGEELPNRQLIIPGTNSVVTDTVLRWADVVDSAPLSRSEIPDRFYLGQNYPNPFNPTTAVSFHLPAGQAGLSAASDVKLVVYDLMGREVAVLVNEKKVSGRYEVTFDGSGLASGVYFYRIQVRHTDGTQAGSFVQTRKLILLR
jgi:hypothetical protein